MIQTFVLPLAGVGLVISAYFTAIATGFIHPQGRHLPRPCRMEERTCEGLLRSADARVFGIPNVVVGLVYYAGLLVVALHRDAFNDLVGFLVLPGLLSVVLGVYLSIRLMVVHRVRCALCLGTHVINVLLFVIFLVGL